MKVKSGTVPDFSLQLNGVFLIDKPAGWTSHDAVAVLRKRLCFEKIGHTGTLDPAATGLLVLLLGSATKSQSALQGCSKVYGGVITLGVQTDTWDAAGKILEQSTVPEISGEKIAGLLSGFEGKIMQEIPPFSAVKYKGERLYKLARGGKEVPVIKREAEITWNSYNWAPPELSFELKCSGGTYVRSIAHELGRTAGCGAHLKSLRRLSVAGWDVKDAMPGDNLKTAAVEEIKSRILSLPPVF